MKLSVQCYTVRDQMTADPVGTLQALRDMGLNYVELSSTYGLTAEEMKKQLNRLNLKVSGSHAGLDALENHLKDVIEENKALGNDAVFLAWVSKDRYEHGWDKFAYALEPIAQEFDAEGMIFGYHNHDFEFQLQDGKPGLDVFFNSSDPKLIKSQLDAYWVAYGGYDPAAYIKKLKGRIPQVHFKDGKLGEGKPHYLPVGEGDLKWDSIMDACYESDVEFASIELDSSPGDPLDAVRASVDYLRSKGIRD